MNASFDATGFFQDSTACDLHEGLTLRYDMPLLQGFGKEVNHDPDPAGPQRARDLQGGPAPARP